MSLSEPTGEPKGEPKGEPLGPSAPMSSKAAPSGSLRAHPGSALTSQFRPLFVVGRGGMGSIEVAIERSEDGSERVVALKRMLPSAVLDKRLTEMFLREAKLASMLEHPNVVHATSFGERDGELYLVMEYIEGEPLSRVVALANEKGITLALPLVAHVLAEICEGLHAAHELVDDCGRPLNVVHRDISPQNVMVSYEGQAKLLDFGVAKIEALESDGRTKTGEVKGKTAYMSPEQAMGDPIDRRSDLYSVGAVLFEAVTGRKMWGGGTDLEVLRRMALEEPPGIEDVAPGTPDAICRLHKRLVAREPSKRPSSAMEVARELRTFIASTGTHPDARVVRSLMTGLFAVEIERRRSSLRQALDQLPPAEADELRASLAGLPATDVTPVPATRGLGASGAWPRSTRTLATVGTAFLAVVAAVVLLLRGGTTTTATPATAPIVTTASSPPSASPAVPAPPPPVDSVAAKAAPASAPPIASVDPPPRVVLPRVALGQAAHTSPVTEPSAKAGPHDTPRPAPPPPVSPPKAAGPLDVDPAPF